MKHAGERITITANKRLARRLLAEANARAETDTRAAGGGAAWEREPILPWGAWLRLLYDELLLTGGEGRALLPPLAETLLWEETVTQEVEGRLPLVDTPGTARSMQSAWRLLCDHELSFKVLLAHDSAETQLLARCIDAFTRRCREQALFDEGRLSARISAAFEQGLLPLPSHIVFYGFDELPPARRRLLASLEGQGVRVEQGAARWCEDARPRRLLLDDGDLEVRSAVRWATKRLVENGAQRIAIVAPQLADQRTRLLQELEESLEPKSLFSGQRANRTLFNISLGEALSEAPLAHDARLWWRLAAGASLSLDQLLVLLRSPFVHAGESEANARALFGPELCRWGRPEMDLEGLVSLAKGREQRAGAAPKQWIASLAKLLEAARGLRGIRQPAARWRRALRNLLECVGWPGERPLDSDEYQQMKKLGDELEGLACLDLVKPAGFDLPAILRWSERALEARLFQPESITDAPLQVLGQLEAAGQRFDAIWLLGLDEAHWPAATEPNAFLPLSLQREHGMPHATPQLSLEQAQRITRELLASAPEVVVSTPQREGEVECMPSPLIAHLPISEPGSLDVDLQQRPLGAFATGQLERFEDQRGPELDLPAALGGGSGLFADQAACPFRAFAKRRLGAETPERPEAGLDAITIGNLVHWALEKIWRVLQGHAGLVAMDETRRDALVAEAVDGAIVKAREGKEDVFQPRLTKLLRRRLEKLMLRWLEIEAQRSPFRVVAREERIRLEVGGLSCNVQVDRIDELPDGRLVILDYKTSKAASSGGWLLERIREPQLPLYTLAAKSTIGGVALAKVRRDGAAGFEGLWGEEEIFPAEFSKRKSKRHGSKEEELSFEQRLVRWKDQLEALAKELVAGVARVTPSSDSCRYCDLGGLCRHRELDIVGEHSLGPDDVQGNPA